MLVFVNFTHKGLIVFIEIDACNQSILVRKKMQKYPQPNFIYLFAKMFLSSFCSIILTETALKQEFKDLAHFKTKFGLRCLH